MSFFDNIADIITVCTNLQGVGIVNFKIFKFYIISEARIIRYSDTEIVYR